ncbi:MAG TPA: carbohydrate porin [Candidatus Tectomicrobia bacterium]|nr:carbohydrate porin [Candidatus Tectomicrobia bacterium]
MKRLWAYLCLIGVWGGGMAWAQLPQLDNYSGDVWSRPGLTGDWGSLRNTLAKRGINLDVDLVHSLQGLNAGGSLRNQDSVQYRYGGHAEYLLNVDTGKLGLWPGGFLKIKGESQFGSYLQGKHTGALLAPDAAALYPLPFDEETTLTSVVFTQFLAKSFGIYLGKLDTFSGDANAFAHEWKTQFMNVGFGPNPVTFNTIPYSTLGAGFLLLPTESVVFNFSALSPGGTANSAGFDELFEDGVALGAELRVEVKPFGLPGHQLIGGTWNSQTYTSLAQDLRTAIPVGSLLSGEIPLSSALSEVQIREQSGSWAVYYNFDQFVYTTTADGSQGIGIFGRVGFGDRNTNVIEQFYSFGIGGQGMLPGRDRDRFGIGVYYANFSHDLPGLVLSGDEIGLEIFYNIAATNWLYVTPDIQVIEPAGQRASTAFLTGLRVQMRF